MEGGGWSCGNGGQAGLGSTLGLMQGGGVYVFTMGSGPLDWEMIMKVEIVLGVRWRTVFEVGRAGPLCEAWQALIIPLIVSRLSAGAGSPSATSAS